MMLATLARLLQYLTLSSAFDQQDQVSQGLWNIVFIFSVTQRPGGITLGSRISQGFLLRMAHFCVAIARAQPPPLGL